MNFKFCVLASASAVLLASGMANAAGIASERASMKDTFVTGCTKGVIVTSYEASLRKSGAAPSSDAIYAIQRMTPIEMREMLVNTLGEQGARLQDLVVQSCSCMADKLYAPYPDSEFVNQEGRDRVLADINQKTINLEEPEVMGMVKACSEQLRAFQNLE